MLPPVGLNDILRTISRIRTVLDTLRKREAGELESPASGFPYSLNLKSFRPGDEVVVVATGWIDDGTIRGVTVHTRVEFDGERHVLTLTPHAPEGARLPGEALVHVSWIAMV